MIQYRGLIAFVAALTAFAGIAQADLLEDVKGRGKLVCGVLTGFEPFGYQDPETHRLVGYEIDYCDELAKWLGVDAEPKVVTTQGRIPELSQGRVDVLVALISYTKERDQVVDYSGLYLRSESKFMVLKSSGLAGAGDLADRRIGVSKGSPLEKFLRGTYPSATVVSFDDKSASYLALKSGKVDALLTQTTTLMAMKNLDPEGDDMLVLPESIYPTDFGIVVRPGEAAFLVKTNAFLASAEKSGLADRIFEKWFGPDTQYNMKREFEVGTPAR
ncbi:MAG: transporter substrate-binding domain-containing protein [Rhodospirillum sp.]|nr:transporter substrate-binding domain-containing protein [Rhodospirillum sp.]MCF8490586.1 transporter substrate-binding domain-containing protein [Rhodospirillum sp.]MCF8502714.1 transporter substrate-binding domain-containing protein [Rhodospirillum sp.]